MHERPTKISDLETFSKDHYQLRVVDSEPDASEVKIVPVLGPKHLLRNLQDRLKIQVKPQEIQLESSGSKSN